MARSKKILKPATCLFDLTKPEYKALAEAGAENLGWSPRFGESAVQYLQACMMESGEESVLDEVNFCLDLLD